MIKLKSDKYKNRGEWSMALIKCPECGKEISDTAESCIHCGYPLTDDNSKQDEPFCTSCGNPLKPGSKFCGKCGTPRDWDIRSAQESQHSQSPGVSVLGAQEFNTPSGRKFKSRFTALGILGIIFGIIGLVIFLPIVFNSIGLIFGIITFASNPKEEKEGMKAIWEYKNAARGIGLSALIINIIGLVLMIINMINAANMF